MSGKDGLNSWVNIFKKNWVEKLVGKLVKKFSGKTLWTNWVDKLGDKNGWKIVLKNCVKKLCEKIRWKIV